MVQVQQIAGARHLDICRVYDAHARHGAAPVTTAYDVERWAGLLGAAYLDTPDMSEMPEVRHIWQQFAREVEAQFVSLLRAGFRFEFTHDDPVNPETGKPDMLYLYEKLMITGTLPVYTGDSDHPLLGARRFWYDSQYITANDMFRAVHDILGHMVSGAEFNFRDEVLAYQYHARTFSDTAKVALYCETMGQLTAGHIREKVFPVQKCIILPWREIPATLQAR